MIVVVSDAWCMGGSAPDFKEVSMGTEGAVRVEWEGVEQGVQMAEACRLKGVVFHFAKAETHSGVV